MNLSVEATTKTNNAKFITLGYKVIICNKNRFLVWKLIANSALFAS